MNEEGIECNGIKFNLMKWKQPVWSEPIDLTKWMRYEMNCRRQDKWMKAWSMRAVMKPWIRSFHSTQWMLMKRMGARRHEFTAINEINASEEQAAQADKGDQFQFISIRNEKTEWNWTKYDANKAGVANSIQLIEWIANILTVRSEWVNCWRLQFI